MIAEIITIGDELLVGKTIDTNSPFLAQELLKLGIETKHFVTCEDTEEAIIASLELAHARADYIFMTGGLGPTNDDVTKKACCTFFNTELERSSIAFDHLTQFFESRDRKLEGVNLTQADLPKTCTYLENSVGTAPGMLFHKDGVQTVSMPGVPRETKHIFSESYYPLLAESIHSEKMEVIDIQTVGIAEAKLSEIIEDLNIQFPEGIKLAYLPRIGSVTIRMYVLVSKLEEAQLIQQQLQDELEDVIYGVGDLQLEEMVIELLRKNGKTIGTAESCTGGGVAKKITSVSGSSDVFEGSIVSYSNRIKEAVLGVSSETLKIKGAVSEETVIQMVHGVLNTLGTNYGLATSGIAGPTGGTKDKPVGTVWIAVGDKNRIETKLLRLGKNRAMNIESSIIAVLNLLRKFILK